MTRALSPAFGLLMVAAVTVRADGPALVLAAVALAAVVVGLVHRVGATLAVVASALALAVSGPAPVLAALAGLAATVYLALRHGRPGAGSAASTMPTMPTMPTMFAALGLSATAVLGAAFPLTLPWVPLMAPLAVVASYLAVVSRYV